MPSKEDIAFRLQEIHREIRAHLLQIEALERERLGLEQKAFRDDDSPKGETVPGVRYYLCRKSRLTRPRVDDLIRI